jgi:hypothetical protein
VTAFISFSDVINWVSSPCTPFHAVFDVTDTSIKSGWPMFSNVISFEGKIFVSWQSGATASASHGDETPAQNVGTNVEAPGLRGIIYLCSNCPCRSDCENVTSYEIFQFS